METLAYDSDHDALTFSVDSKEIFQGYTHPPPSCTRFNFKKTNWKEFTNHFNHIYTEQTDAERNIINTGNG